jgi:hypothetical protein
MDEQEKAFVIASIKLKAEHDKKEKKKAEARAPLSRLAFAFPLCLRSFWL